VYVDLDQSSTDDSREIHGRGLSANRNCHSIREPIGAREHLPGRDGWIAGPNPVPHRMISSPGLAGAAPVT